MTREDRIMAALGTDPGIEKATAEVRDYLRKWQEDHDSGRPVDCQEVAVANAVQMVAPAIINAAMNDMIKRHGGEIWRKVEAMVAETKKAPGA